MKHARRGGIRLCTIACLGLAGALVACAGGSGSTQEPPAAEADDSKATIKVRLEAIKELGTELQAAQGTDTNVHDQRETLKNVIWARNATDNLRIAALKALALDVQNEADTEHMLSLMIPTESASREWGMLTAIGEYAAAKGWKDLIPAFVVSWARPMGEPDDDHRPERKAIQLLAPDRPVEDVVFDVFAHRGNGSLDTRGELAAWELLTRIDHGRTVELVRTLDTDTATDSPLLRSIRKGARDLASIPETSEQLQWLERLAAPENAEFWSTATRVIAGLTEDQREGMSLANVAAVVWTSRYATDRMSKTADELFDEAKARLKGRTIYRRANSRISRFDETLRTAEPVLAWGDAVSILAAMDAMDEEQVVNAFFRQADADHTDTSTEYGGAMLVDEAGAFIAFPFEPRPNERLGDRQFVASHDLIDGSDTALDHYHFHAASTNNSEYAGPSDADIKYAHKYGRSCLVLTFISDDLLDVDWYRGNGAVVDLSTIRRISAKEQ